VRVNHLRGSIEEGTMSTWIWIVIAIAVVLAIGAITWLAYARSRSARLRNRFGPEYEREVSRAESRRMAESELSDRERRIGELDIRPLDPAARERYSERWSAVQARFVDAPHEALSEADELVTTVMRERGYPTGDFDRRAADVSVGHPTVVENYRLAHEISEAAASGEASTEDMRQGLVYYRALFAELLEDGRDNEKRPNDMRETR
jgi:hypothetical protein